MKLHTSYIFSWHYMLHKHAAETVVYFIEHQHMFVIHRGLGWCFQHSHKTDNYPKQFVEG